MTMTYGNGREETWKEGKKVQREQGKKRTLYTGEQGEKEVLPKGETSGPEATLSVLNFSWAISGVVIS